ncbi:MAG: Ni/Fe-hydrogenase, b-type cytochrome subunit [Thermoanaerobaculia bacterium]
MSAAALPAAAAGPPRSDTDLVRVYVWEWPVRLTHWVIVASVVVLAATGIYIGRPFLISSGPAGQRFLMGTAKVIHSYAAIAFSLAVISRVLWMFFGNTYARWDKFIPAARRRREGLFGTLKFYLFALRKPPGFIGHNPLAGLTYTLVFFLYFTMIATGLAMYSVSARVDSPFGVFQFLVPIFGGAQTARWIHHVVMWLLLGFAVHHVYSAVYMSQVEANATVESIFSGYKFVPPEDVIYSGYRYVSRSESPERQRLLASEKSPDIRHG